MLVPIGVLGECFRASRTFVRPLTGMHVLVLLEFVDSGESFAAVCAIVVFDIRVYFGVLLETAFGIVEVAADFAYVDDRLEVLGDMFHEQVFLAVGFGADGACEGFLLVHVEVFFGGGAGVELEAADTAPVLHGGVVLHLVVEDQLFWCFKAVKKAFRSSTTCKSVGAPSYARTQGRYALAQHGGEHKLNKDICSERPSFWIFVFFF